MINNDTNMISIITPIYNRRHLLDAAYQSLLRQSNKDFEWIVIDDGSTDAADELCQTWIGEQKISIVYERQENGGVNRARNHGIELAQGELIMLLDDDDYLSDDAVDTIYRYWHTINDNSKIAGFLFLSGYQSNGEVIGTCFGDDVSINNYIKVYCRDKIKGDKTIVHKTEIQKKFPFPVFEGEKFAPEAIMFDRIAKEYDYLCVNKILQYKEYLDKGLSNNMYPESEMINGLLAFHYGRTDKAFPFRTRWRHLRKWLRLKLCMNTSLFSVFCESKCFWVCLLNFPIVLTQILLIRIGKKLGISKVQKYI